MAKGFALRLSLFVLAAIAAAAVFAPWIAPCDPDALDIANRLSLPGTQAHLLGTDALGRDVLSRLVFGARTSLGAVLAAAAFSVAAGFVIGSAAGWAGGRTDAAVMRVCDVLMTFPSFLLALFLTGILGRGLANVIFALALTHWAWYARLARGMTLAAKSRTSIAAARVAGGTETKIFLRHVAPSALPQLLVFAALDLGHMMLHVSALSFLGLGVQPPTPEWGVMIHDARAQMWTDPWLILLPGAAIFLTVLAASTAGESLRDRTGGKPR